MDQLQVTKSTTNVVDGTVGGAGSLVGGVLVSTAVVVGAPIGVCWVSYDAMGPLGVVFGVPIGVSVGAIAGTAVVVGSAYSCLTQIIFGIVRTPSYLYAVGSSAVGRSLDWDTRTEEWVYYDLYEDARTILNLTNPQINDCINGDRVYANGETASTPVLEKKAVKEREYYNILGVEPEAGSSEIKKAYYLKCREHHPDKNLNDPTAHEKFQKVGAAYLVLSDPKLRRDYDTNGKEAVASNTPTDSGALFSMIFGSENFEPVIGELWIAPVLKMFTDGTFESNEDFALKQRVREVQCALTLVSKLKKFTDGNQEEFLRKAVEDATALSESPLGASLLGLIGAVYVDRSRSEINTIEGLMIAFKKTGVSVYDVCAMANSAASTYSAFSELTKTQQTAPETVKDAKDAEAAREKLRQQTKAAYEQVVWLLWIVTKIDVAQTVDRICIKALHDHSVDDKVLAGRREALLILGNTYLEKSGSAEAGLADLVNRMCMQTGVYESKEEAGSGPKNTTDQ